MLSSNIKDKIRTTYASTNKGEVELEARFGLFKQKNFIPGVSRQVFNRVKSYFDSKAKNQIITRTTDYIMGNVRKTIVNPEGDDSASIIWITKKRIWNIPNQDYGIRYSMSNEIMVDPIPDSIFSPTIIREKSRTSYLVFGNAVRVDLTLVTSSEKNRDNVTYEIEVELLDPGQLVNFEKTIEITLRLVLDTIVLYTENLRYQVVNEINSILGSTVRGRLDHKPLVQARNLKLKDMVYGGLIGNQKTGYSVTHKADGQRKMLVFLKSGVWLVAAPNSLTRISEDSRSTSNLTGTILDGELIPKEKRLEGAPKAEYWYLAFDALAWNRDRSIQNKPHGQRMQYAQTVSDKIKGELLTVNTKSFKNISTPQEFFKINREMFREQLLLAYKQDGFMFTPQNTEYNPHSDYHKLYERSLTRYPDICKWKPQDELTIDFLIKWKADPNSSIKRSLDLYANQKGEPILFKPSINKVDFLSPITLDLPNDTIVEYAYDYQRELLYPTRVRHDKSKPNKLEIAEDVWSDIQTPIDKETMIGNTFLLLRRYHNRIKRDLFIKSLEVGQKQKPKQKMYLLDIGSGRGGDINKWKGFDKIVAVEPNSEHIVELERRLEDSGIKNRVFILQAGGEETFKIKKAVDEWCGGRVDVVSSMLSLTFFWQNPKLLDSLSQTILVNIKPRGKFIFLTMDGNLVEQTFEPAFNTGLVLNKIKFGEIATLNYFGDKIPKELHIDIKDSIVSEQTEWLVRLDDLLVRMAKYGFSFTMMKKADQEKFLTEDEIIMTQMYTYGILEQTQEIALPDIDVSGVKIPLKSPVETLPPLKSPVETLPPIKSPVETLPSIKSELPKLKPIKKSKSPSIKKEKEKKMLGMDQVEKVKISWYDENLVRIGSIGDGSCFFHAVLNAYLKEYQTDPDLKFRRDFVRNLRRDVSLTLALPDPNQPSKTRYQTAANGQFVNLHQEQLAGLEFKDVFEQEVDFSLEGLTKLFDSDNYLGDEIYSYVADLLNIDIYVMRITDQDLFIHLNTHLPGRERKSLVISGNGYHFETIGIERNNLYQTFFLPNDPFIQKIRSFSS